MLKAPPPVGTNRPLTAESWIEATVQFINAEEEAAAHFIAECMEKGALGSVEQDAAHRDPPADASGCEACGRFSNLHVYFPTFMDLEEILNVMEEETKRIVKTASAGQVRQPIYNSSVGRWKKYERHLAPLLEALGPLCPS